jgi:hypothetical protein
MTAPGPDQPSPPPVRGRTSSPARGEGPRLALLAGAAIAYVFAAWLVAPGFYDGIAPPAPYHWVSPPPDLRSGNQAPGGGQAAVPVQGGVVQAGHVFTTDDQASITLPARAFAAPAGGAPLTIQIQPVSTYPDLGGIVVAGNVYLVTASAPPTGTITIALRYGSQQVGPPTDIFEATGATSPWKALASATSPVPFTLSATTRTLGYFVVGFPPGTPAPAAPASPAGPPVAVLVAVAAAALAVLAALPLAMARRRAARKPRRRGHRR